MTEKELRDLIRAKDPSVVVTAKTLADEVRLKKIKRNLCFDNMFFVPRIHRGGNLVLFWKNSIKLKVVTLSKNHIDCLIDKDSDKAWHFTGFYGEPSTLKWCESWELLRQLNNRYDLPWLCLGDFNEILRSLEKEGGSNCGHAQMQLFRDVVDECGFMDIGFTGPPFTWKQFFIDGHTI